MADSPQMTIFHLERDMHKAAKNLEFEKAAIFRDKLKELRKDIKIARLQD